jgi:hypothetical protein
VKPQLDIQMFRPADGETTVAEIVEATIAYARSAREAHNLDADRVLTFAIPYDPQLRESWEMAEAMIVGQPGGDHIEFDWANWDVWTVPRAGLGACVPSGWYVRPADGKACLPAMVCDPRKSLDPAELRALAAEALAMADFLDQQAATQDANMIEGGL